MNIMFDLETWGTEPGCDIRSIGACVFAHETGLVHDGSLGTIKPFYVACENPAGELGDPMVDDGSMWWDDANDTYRRYPLTRDPNTVKWWDDQSDDAKAAFDDPIDLREALERFDSWLGGLFNYEETPHDTDCIRLWSHGAAFDAPILAAAYRAVGLPVPWHYRAPRDTRTLFDVAGIVDHSAWLKDRPGPMGIPHHALDDAICQARGVCDAYARLRGAD